MASQLSPSITRIGESPMRSRKKPAPVVAEAGSTKFMACSRPMHPLRGVQQRGQMARRFATAASGQHRY